MLSSQIVHVLPCLPLSLIPLILLLPQWKLKSNPLYRTQLPRTSCDPEPRFQENICRSFLNFVEKAVVHEQNLDTWEFGKGALSANVYFFDNHSLVTRAAANPVLG
jgi:hypothetical protein